LRPLDRDAFLLAPDRRHERQHADKDENSVRRADCESALGSNAPEPDASSGGYFQGSILKSGFWSI